MPRHSHPYTCLVRRAQGQVDECGYTAQFAREVITCAQRVLEEEGRFPEVLVEGGGFPEEDLIEEPSEEEEEEEEVKQGMKEWKKKEETPRSWRLEQLHNRLGHPTNNTLAKMLSLSGASKEVVQQARLPRNQSTRTIHEGKSNLEGNHLLQGAAL